MDEGYRSCTDVPVRSSRNVNNTESEKFSLLLGPATLPGLVIHFWTFFFFFISFLCGEFSSGHLLFAFILDVANTCKEKDK